MANPKHLALAQEGRDSWNKWRRRNAGERADFSGTDFTAPALAGISFAGFEFGPDADFSRCVFGDADHRGVAAKELSPYAAEVAPFLAGGAWFYGARFGEGADFSGCVFRGTALFQNATFGGNANFAAAQFGGEANFVAAKFGDGASFAGTAFGGSMKFERARFAGLVSFAGGEPLPRLVFRQARFGGTARFGGRTLAEHADFAFASFDLPPEFAATTGREHLDLHGACFRLRGGLVPGWTTRTETLAAIRTLRAAAHDGGAHAAERDLAVLERRAERGVAFAQAHRASWAEPLRKVGLYWRALLGTLLLFLYGAFSDCGRSILRPLLWLLLVNGAAWFAFRALAKPASTVVGRTARGTWTWMKSVFVSQPSVPGTTLSAEQEKSLFEFWWSSAIPGSISRAAYEKSAISLFGTEGIPRAAHILQASQTALNLVLLVLLALAIRNHFRGRV